MKEMVGGCCVCSDEHGWTENPLVYCDGQNCTVAVHQACYGIVTVPTGPWYCRKCESQERSARVRCELCPSRDGALKKTDNQGWAHVVCALYIPEVRFGNVTTMEPIILQLIPPERFAKSCYICTENNKPSRATAGACMQCNKSGCKQQFHVTCAQALGLLCEEAGNYLDNVKYCGYCQHHYSKLKKGGNVKTIPPYKPITHETGSSDPPSSPEKDTTITNNSVSATSASGSAKLLQTSSSAATISTITPIASSTPSSSSSSSSKQRKSSSTSKSSTNSSSSIGNNAPPSTSSTTGTSSSKSSTSSSKDKDKSSKSLSSKSSSSSKSHEKESSSSSSSSRDKSSKSKSSNKDNVTISPDNSTNSNNSSSHKLNDSKNSDKINSTILSTISSPNLLTKNSSTSSSLSTSSDNMSVKDINSPTTKHSNNVSMDGTANSENSVILVNNDGSKNNSNSISGSSSSASKKRKSDSMKSTTIDDINKDMIKDVSVTIVPITNLDKLDTLDIEKSSAKKSKTIEMNTTSHQSQNEPLKSVSPNQNVIQQTINKQQHTPSTQNPILKPPILKDITENRVLQSASPFSSNQTSQPSLVVSVPLSTAGVTVPQTHIPTSSTNNQVIHSNSGLYQQINQNREQQVQVNTGNRVSPIVNFQQNQVHIGRKSPIIQGAAMSPVPHITDNNPNLQHTNSNNQSTVPSPHLNSGSESLIGITSSASATATETGMIKVTYEKQPIQRITQLQEDLPARRSRTPETNYSAISYNSGLKFTYEAQPNSTSSTQALQPPTSVTPQPVVKDSPPSSPGSEAGSRKRSRKSEDGKDVKVFHNGVVATHMLGNQLNPASSVAQKMTDQLNMEIEAHSIYTSSSLDSGPQLIGPPYPGKNHSNSRSSSTQSGAGSGINSSQLGNTHQSLEQLLERQWEQGSQFLMEQAQHFDIASLLSCLHQLRTENVRLEDHVNSLITRRDHLLAVNARLAIPLNPTAAPPVQGPFNNMHINGPTDTTTAPGNISSNRSNRSISHYGGHQQHTVPAVVENGVDFRHSSTSSHMNTSSRQSTSMSYSTAQHGGSSRHQSSVSINVDQSRGRSSSGSFQMQQSVYSSAHQAQIRPDDSQVKPS